MPASAHPRLQEADALTKPSAQSSPFLNRDIRLIVFDLDGTLVDTFDDIAAAANFALRMAGRPDQPVDLIRSRVGGGGRNLMRQCLGPDASDGEVDAAFVHWRDYYAERPSEKARLYPGVAEGLRVLRARGIRLAVLSNKLHMLTERIVRDLGLDQWIERVQGEDPARPRKPDPALLLEIMKDLDARPENTLMVGDGDADMIVARNAGIDAVGVSWGVRSRASLEELGARRVVDTMEDLVSLVANQGGQA
jgi:phosphoglycolate phosphatase